MPLDIERMKACLRGYRAMASYSQEEAADAINVSRLTMSNYERGKIIPRMDKAAALADLYGVTLDELMGREAR